jgi:2-amino-4-hydroxy-6-hydroxymethyldihydropteridine diphosphokinase
LVLIGLGSNQGPSAETVPAAMRALAQFALPGTLRCSRLWQTSPVDCPPGSNEFINAAVCFEAREGLTPESLLRSLKALEVEFGRGKKLVRNAPRELDLDLLVYDDHERDSDAFILPHPRAVNRLFVLAPAAEIAPDLQWPGLDKTVQELLDALETDEQAMPVADRAAGC